MEQRQKAFEDATGELARALDDWARCLSDVTDRAQRPSRKALVRRLRLAGHRIDEPLLSYWLKGHRQLLVAKANRMPSQADTAALAQALGPDAAAAAELLVGHGEEIAVLRSHLGELGGAGWRRKAVAYLGRGGPDEDGPVPAGLDGTGEGRRSDGDGASATLENADTARAGSTRPVNTTVRRWLPVAAAVLVPAAVLPLVLLAGRSGAGMDAAAPAPPPPSAASTASTAGEPPTAAPERADLPLFSPAAGARTEIGGNHRCGRIRYVEGLAWTACTRVDESGLSFAVRLTNTGPDAVTVRAKVGWVRTRASHPCPGSWGTGVRIVVAPGQTLLSPPELCVQPLLPATAYQARAEVGELDALSLYREMSMTVHIQSDGRTAIWADEA
ncbi:hypothetical protein ACIRD3_32325 [Kitasatospora sp. NPDC093550]|uniref:hypothetical protein n=1 Tax=Kitasatospora sp. NPDC093550 TaxID=3364089 RepID=UPI00382AA795